MIENCLACTRPNKSNGEFMYESSVSNRNLKQSTQGYFASVIKVPIGTLLQTSKYLRVPRKFFTS